MARFVNGQVPEVVQPFWAALQLGEFISDAAAQAGTYRKQGTRWVAACGGVRPRRGRDLKGRCLSFAEREEIAAVVKDKPKIDLEINFDYNSADISAKSLTSVQALGRALSNAELKGSTFVVAGHTDAAGGEVYNQELSERRAEAIKRYLVDKYGINGTDLVTVGYGKSKLKDPNQPMAESNRRVQVVNMENKTTASK